MIGKHTYGQQNISLNWKTNNVDLKIGSFCSIGKNISIYLGGSHRSDWISTYPFGHIQQTIFNNFDGTGHPKSNGDVIIGNDVWIGDNVTIMSGVKIGDGAILANNSHIVKDVEPYSMVGGNPGKLIKKRFSDEVIEKLLMLKWWEMDDKIINEISPLLCSPKLDELFNRFNL
jgi:acetyltransferase-like isoleucine patch superfamily enzyme